MPIPETAARRPRFCRHCGAALPTTDEPRFCIECGGPISVGAPAAPAVQLPNARVAQSVIGGTIRLATSGAIPPGLWLHDEPPGPEDVVAIYAPLRAIVGGWSGLSGAGWRRDEQAPALAIGSTMIFRFETRREWFAAPGCGQGLRLHIQLRAQAAANEGHTRRGFRYRAYHDPPMEVAAAWWVDPATGARSDRPLPQIQIMAPPRIPRVSDHHEPIATMPERDAEAWAREGQVHGLFHLLYETQQRTPAGRGLPLAEAEMAWLPQLLGRPRQQYRVQAFRPLACDWAEWQRFQPRLHADARNLGLDLGTDLVVEWWLDRQGYDCVIFKDARQLYDCERAVIAFRRAQIVRIGE
ncbi:MAG TPA: zinc ribbon domain-containing protein [Roseiflexaceae bacterium]